MSEQVEESVFAIEKIKSIQEVLVAEKKALEVDFKAKHGGLWFFLFFLDSALSDENQLLWVVFQKPDPCGRRPGLQLPFFLKLHFRSVFLMGEVVLNLFGPVGRLYPPTPFFFSSSYDI